MRAVTRLLMATALVLGAGCAQKDWIDRTLVTVDVTGTWSGFTGGAGVVPKEILLELEQQGSTVKGFMRLAAGGASPVGVRPGPITGTVAGDVFRFQQQNGSVEGELTVSGDEMNGRTSLYGSGTISLRRIDPSSRPASPPR